MEYEVIMDFNITRLCEKINKIIKLHGHENVHFIGGVCVTKENPENPYFYQALL